MDEKAAKPLKLLGRGLRAVIGWTALALGLFALAGWIGSSIPRNEGWQMPQSGVPIMVESNGVHTELVLPVTHRAKDWRETFPTAARDLGGRRVTHIGIGWGDREVFLHNPTWADLEPGSVLRIVTVGGPGVIRVEHLHDPQPSPSRRILRLREESYRALVQRIEAELPDLAQNETRTAYDGHLPGQYFYDAVGDYTLGNTCNQWTSDRLADAGVEIGVWTPFASGVMKWIEQPSR